MDGWWLWYGRTQLRRVSRVAMTTGFSARSNVDVADVILTTILMLAFWKNNTVTCVSDLAPPRNDYTIYMPRFNRDTHSLVNLQ